MKEWKLRADGGSLRCWRQAVRERGSTQDGKTLCRNGTNGFLEISKPDEKEKIEEMHQHKVAQMIKECGGKRGSLSQTLQA